MVKENKKIVKYADLGTKAKANCVDQYVNIICPYDEFEGVVDWKEHIDLFVEATPDQFYFDENGDWYDEGRKVR